MHSRTSLPKEAALVALAAFTVWISWRAKAVERGPIGHKASIVQGKAAPDFTLESLDGRKLTLADYRGKTLVVSFWASWCGPCRVEMPLLADFYTRTHSAHTDFEVVAISVDATKDAALGASRTLKIPFPVLLDGDGRVADSFGVEAIPMMFVIDKSGKVAHSHEGFQPGFDILLAQEMGIGDYSPNYNFRPKKKTGDEK